MASVSNVLYPILFADDTDVFLSNNVDIASFILIRIIVLKYGVTAAKSICKH